MPGQPLPCHLSMREKLWEWNVWVGGGEDDTRHSSLDFPGVLQQNPVVCGIDPIDSPTWPSVRSYTHTFMHADIHMHAQLAGFRGAACSSGDSRSLLLRCDPLGQDKTMSLKRHPSRQIFQMTYLHAFVYC